MEVRYKRRSISAKMANKSESEIQTEILKWLSDNRYYHFRMYLGPIINHIGSKKIYSKNPNSGLPDILGLSKTFPRFFFGIEIKSAHGKLSEKQREKILKLEENGGFIIVCRSLQEMKDTLLREESRYESMFCQSCRDKAKRELEYKNKCRGEIAVID